MVNNKLFLYVMTQQRVNVKQDMKWDPGQQVRENTNRVGRYLSSWIGKESQGCGVLVASMPLTGWLAGCAWISFPWISQNQQEKYIRRFLASNWLTQSRELTRQVWYPQGWPTGRGIRKGSLGAMGMDNSLCPHTEFLLQRRLSSALKAF